MTKRFDFERRFAPTDEKQLRDPDYLSFFGERPSGVKTWQDLLEVSPIVVLGEGRIGKTYEFVEQVHRLKAQGLFAFFIPLERLHDENLEDALEPEDVDSLGAWKSSGVAIIGIFHDEAARDRVRDREIDVSQFTPEIAA